MLKNLFSVSQFLLCILFIYNITSALTHVGQRKNSTMDPGIARLFSVNKICLYSVMNTTFENPPIEKTCLPCTHAGRSLPCSNCLPDMNMTITYPPSPLQDGILLPSFNPLLLPASRKLKPASKASLSRKETPNLRSRLLAFRDTLRGHERERPDADANIYRPSSLYLTSSIIDTFLHQFTRIVSLDDRSHRWLVHGHP